MLDRIIFSSFSLRMKAVSFFLLLCFICVSCLPGSQAHAQYQGHIYGDVVLKSGQIYTGTIKWSGGQHLWSDVLTVTKGTNKSILKYLSEAQIKKLSSEEDRGKISWQFMSLWEDKVPSRKNEILCRFGDIRTIHITGADKAEIYFKNGKKLRVEPYKNDPADLGKNFVVYTGGDSKTLKWDDISTVNFKATPNDPRLSPGEPLYGTVYTSNGPVTGFIQWNKNQYLTSHKLRGINNNKQAVTVSFSTVARIEKKDNQALIQLRSGESISAGATGSSNSGVVVMHPQYGRVLVEWKAFKSLTLEALPATGLAYDNYPPADHLLATVTATDGRAFTGACVFDLDEEWNVEILDGNKDGLYYQIPFYNISKLAPYRQKYAQVTLKNNSTLLLGWANDVSDKNWGVLIWLPDKKYQYLAWDQIKEISFR